MAHWISRDNNFYSPYNVWTKRPTWEDEQGWIVRDNSGHRDYQQPVDSWSADGFKKLSTLDVECGTLVRIKSVIVSAGPAVETHKKAADTDG